MYYLIQTDCISGKVTKEDFSDKYVAIETAQAMNTKQAFVILVIDSTTGNVLFQYYGTVSNHLHGEDIKSRLSIMESL